MKALVPWVCLITLSANQITFADDFSAYRLGNYNKAIEPLTNQSGKNAVADYYLGRMYLYGYGQLKNNQMAIRYFNQSAQKGYMPAVQFMAKYTLLHEKNPQEALLWFKKAAEAGDVEAQMFMASAYLYGVGVKKNKDIASKYYINAAKNGSSIAQFTLANDFIGSHDASTRKLGFIWLNKSIAGGNPKALAKLGELLINGKLIDKNEDKALELLKQAATKGFVPAMVTLGEIALQQNQREEALQWFKEVENHQNVEAYLALAHIYLQEKSSIYDPKMAFYWTSKAAQEGAIQGKRELAEMYQKGIGVEADPLLAKQWLDQSNESAQNQEFSLAQAALWLSNGATDKLEQTNFQLKGILSNWQNTSVISDSSYNLSPRLKKITRQTLFQPQFELVQPNEVPISNYYNALLEKNSDFQTNQWTYPHYPLDKQLIAVIKANSPVLVHKEVPAPYFEANYYTYEYDPLLNMIQLMPEGWQAQLNYRSLFNQLYLKAILGEAQAQFQIGQMFQYGLGVEQNDSLAIAFYQNATQQFHLGSEYNLAILYLQHAKDKNDYQFALSELTDAAFKGNKKSQYVLSRILEKGIVDADGTELIAANPEQAVSMLYLAASNQYGPAEYELANYLVGQNNTAFNVADRQSKIAMIRHLYQGAVDRGVSQALLPLAFYNAMDEDKQRQGQAFRIAKDQVAKKNKEAMLLLGLLYDRGIGVSTDTEKAMDCYKKAGENAVSAFILGTYIAEGKRITKDQEKSLTLLQHSTDHQFSYAHFNMAVLQKQIEGDFLPHLIQAYQSGNSHAGIVLADYYLAKSFDAEKMQAAKKIYMGLAEKGDQYAQVKLAYMLQKGLGSEPNLVEAQRWYTASADQDNAVAQYLLGQLYQLGENEAPDYTLAAQWYQKAAVTLPEAWVALGFIDETVNDNEAQALKAYEQAAEKGDNLGAYNLALMYLYGKGIPVNYQKATDLFAKAALNGMYEAMNQLGSMYFNGLGQARDEQKALSWYKKAASLGDSNALYQLGLLSETGVTLNLDFNKALNYYQEAAKQGNEKAMLALARMYHYGLGIEKNPDLAASLYQKLAARHNAYAQYQLGIYYLEGIAVERSLPQGKQLLQQASDNGNIQAQKVLQRLEAQTQTRVSFIEPLMMNKMPLVAGQDASLIYMDALNEWDHGDEMVSRLILQQLITQYPNFAPAKHAFDQLNKARLISFLGQ